MQLVCVLICIDKGEFLLNPEPRLNQGLCSGKTWTRELTDAYQDIVEAMEGKN